MDLSRASSDDVLAQRTRARLYALLAELRRPATTNELAEHLGLHPNGVRLHLERLLDAGLVTRHRARRPRGRPRDQWSLSPEGAPGGQAPRAYGHLARGLVRAIPAHPTRLREVERAGRDVGREFAPADATSTAEALRHTLTALGFQPVVESDPSGRVACRLRNCPYRDSAKESPEVVCTLHRGITRGVLDVVDPRARLASFVPHDPDTAGCEIEVLGSGSHT